MNANLNEEMLRKMKDPKFYLESFTQIKNKQRKFIPFVLNEAQKDLYNSLIFDLQKRIIILKARQLGFSTAVSGFYYHDTIMHPGTITVIIGYNREAASELLEKIKLFWKTTPVELRPTIKYDSRYEISFVNLDSKIVVLPSTETVGRGWTINNLLCTELALWEKAEEKMTTLEASVPIDGRIIVESTPNGIGNLYHEMWVTDNDYIKKEYGWWWGYTEQDIDTIKRRLNNPQKFAQEYGLEFLASGRLVLDKDAIIRQRKNILHVGDTVTWHLQGGDKEGYVFVQDDLRIYQPPEIGGIYVAGVDTSEGVEGGDYSVVTIYNRRTGEEVAFYRDLIAPDRLAERLVKWGKFFNTAMLVVEVNNHGLTTLTALKLAKYPNLYFRPTKIETLAQEIGDKLGWKTSQMTKPGLIDDFNKAIRDNEIIIHSKETCDEMLTYVYHDNGEAAPMNHHKHHDDCLMSAFIGFQGFKVIYTGKLEQIDLEKILPPSGGY